MSAIGTKRTWASAPHMSAFGGKADIAFLHCICPLMTQSGHWGPCATKEKARFTFRREPGRKFVMQVIATTTPDCDANSASHGQSRCSGSKRLNIQSILHVPFLTRAGRKLWLLSVRL